MPTLKPAFDPNGTITAANAPSVNDGASALVIASADKAKALGKKPLARIVSQGSFAQEPDWFTTAPVGAAKQALQRANLTVNDIGRWEVNEAFSAWWSRWRFMRDMEIDHAKVNVRGGAVALGHPIGAIRRAHRHDARARAHRQQAEIRRRRDLGLGAVAKARRW